MKKAVMYGAGNIGRGFIGQLFSQSGYEVVFLDINPVLIDKLNLDGFYPIRIVSDEKYDEILIRGVCGVNASNIEKVASEIAGTEIMATAVGVNVLPQIAKPIALGLKKRWSGGNLSPLNIILCENLLDANRFLERLIKQELNESEKELFDKSVGLVETSIGRMVPVMTEEMQEDNPLRVYVEPFCELPVDKEAFRGEIPGIIHMVPFEPFSFYIQRKLYMHNMGHATMAYLGFLSGCRYIWEASRNSTIKLITLRALMEAAAAMSAEHGVPLAGLLEHAEDLIYRFGNRLLGDTVERVGKDPVRKLSGNDRLVGGAKLCLRQGIDPVYISLGIAAAFMFSPTSDGFAATVRETAEKAGIENALAEFCGLEANHPIAANVLFFYCMLKEGHNLEQILYAAEKRKNAKP